MKTPGMGLLVLQTLLIALAPVAFAAGGYGVGNGGDGTQQPDGTVILRDFLGSPDIQAVDAGDFLGETPDFPNLIEDIANASPFVAARILSQLENCSIYLTQKALPILPSSATGIFQDESTTQIAIRYGNDIVISQPAFEKTEQSYLLLHEALHGLVDGQGPMNTEKVRAIVRGIKEHRHALTSDSLDQLLGTYGFLPIDDTQHTIEQRVYVERVLQALFHFDSRKGSWAAFYLVKDLFMLNEVSAFPERLDQLVEFIYPTSVNFKAGESVLGDAEALFPGAAPLLKTALSQVPTPRDLQAARDALSSKALGSMDAAAALLLSTPGLVAPYLDADLPLTRLQDLGATSSLR